MRIEKRDIEELWEKLGVVRVLEKELFSKLVRSSLNVKVLDGPPYRIDKSFRRYSRKSTVFETARRRILIHAEEARDSGIKGRYLIEQGIIGGAWSLYGTHKRGVAKNVERVDVDPSLFTALVKRVAMFYGADLVGVAPVDDKWLYEEFKLPFRAEYVVVLGFEMDPGASSTPVLSAEVGLGYSRMSTSSLQLAEFLSRLGYHALPQGNEGGLSIPFAVLAGLGELGRSGLLVTPEYGSRVRLAKVFTDAPLNPDRPISFGLWDKCMDCCICADNCPAGAIPYGPPSWSGGAGQKGVLKWRIDPVKCYSFWAMLGRSCGLCIYACPFSRMPWHIHRMEAKRLALRSLDSKL